jgi:hypothetical protein
LKESPAIAGLFLCAIGVRPPDSIKQPVAGAALIDADRDAMRKKSSVFPRLLARFVTGLTCQSCSPWAKCIGPCRFAVDQDSTEVADLLFEQKALRPGIVRHWPRVGGQLAIPMKNTMLINRRRSLQSAVSR